MTHHDISTELADISAITLQPAEQQGIFKVSYQVDMGINRDILEAELNPIFALPQDVVAVDARIVTGEQA